jgi:hypothetical protein
MRPEEAFMEEQARKIDEACTKETSVSAVVSYIVEVYAGSDWYHSNTHKTLIGAKREKVEMERKSSNPRRIVRETREVVKEY